MNKIKKIKFKDLKIRMRVRDSWYNDNHPKEDWGTGVIKEILKTRVKIQFSKRGEVVFDRTHANNFLIKA